MERLERLERLEPSSCSRSFTLNFELPLAGDVWND